MARRLLQVVTAFFGLIAIATGALAMSGLRASAYAAAGLPSVPLLDSNLRFLGGLWLGLGLALVWLTPRIERESVLFRAIWVAIFIGGLGRVMSAAAVGAPSELVLLVASAELLAPPVLVWWQARIARAASWAA